MGRNVKALYFWFLTILGGYRDWSLSRNESSVHKQIIKAERWILEGLKGIVRELSFAGDPENIGGSFWGFCDTVTKWEMWKWSRQHTEIMTLLNSSYSPSSPYWASKRPASSSELSLSSRFRLRSWVRRDLDMLSLKELEIPASSGGFCRLMVCKGISDMN